MRARRRLKAGLAVAVLLATAAGLGPNGASAVSGLATEARVQFVQRVSGSTPFRDDCGDPGPGDGIPDYEAEVHLAVDPANLDHLVATWQQDRYSKGGAARSNLVATSWDGGKTWSRGTIPNLSWCTGEQAARPRATDPWAAIGAGGIAYQASNAALVVLDEAAELVGDVDLDVVLSASADGGGSSWPRLITAATDDGVFWHEKPVIAADPITAGHAYAAWSRHFTPDPFDVYATADVDMGFVRTEDGGASWSPVEIVPPDVEGRLEVPNDLVVARRSDGGTSVVLSFAVYDSRLATPTLQLFTVHSEDGGRHWSTPGRVGITPVISTTDVEGSLPPPEGKGQPAIVEDGQGVAPSLAATPDGTLYAVWHERTAIGTNPDGGSRIHVARSDDMGGTWATTSTIDLSSSVLLPEIAIAGDGTVGLSFYDLRNDVWGDEPLTANVWLRYSRDGARTWSTDSCLAGPFDLRSAPSRESGRKFLGDYSGMVGFSQGFGVLAAVAEPGTVATTGCKPLAAEGGPTDVFFVRVKLPQK